MIGQLKLDARGCALAQREELYGLPVLRAWADPEGWWGSRRLRRAGQSLRRGGALRTLAPAGFAHWGVLKQLGLVPPDPCPFLRAQSAPLTLRALERQGMAPDRATVALRGLRADREMARAAALLCPQVRHLVICAPRGGGELAAWLRREFGIPILPQQELAQVAVDFEPVQEQGAQLALQLYGEEPHLGGLTLTAPALSQEDRQDLPLLAMLWEGGRLPPQGLKIT